MDDELSRVEDSVRQLLCDFIDGDDPVIDAMAARGQCVMAQKSADLASAHRPLVDEGNAATVVVTRLDPVAVYPRRAVGA